jgi:DNA-directed RNA polymerase subunit RPC12/RpoP
MAVPDPAPGAQNPLQEKLGLRYTLPGHFRFFCMRCAQNLEVERSAAGSEIDCPSCHNRIPVPPPPDE